jgi:hypothetical protein
MHTSKFQIRGYEGDVVVIHNGDWSGDAEVIFKEAVFGEWDKKPKPEQRVTIPGRLLAGLAIPVTQRMMSDKIISFLEQLPDSMGVLEKRG